MSDTVIQPISDMAVELNYKKYTHIVSPPENPQIFSWLVLHGYPDPSAKDIVAVAKERFWVVQALCGYRWVPADDPEKHDACQVCMDVAGMHMRNAGE